MSSVVYMIKDKQLSLVEVLEILENPAEDKISTLPAVNPKHGQVYLFSYEGRPDAIKDWRADQYHWKHLGIHSLPKKDPKLKKTYHQRLIAKKPIKFYRHGYQSEDMTIPMVVVQYIGVDYNIDKEEPHGNMKKYTQRSHVRTLPSVMKNICTHIDRTPSEIYKKAVVETQTTEMHMKVQVPKNFEQISNKLKYEKKKGKISHDDLYSIYELHFAIENFVRNYSLAPEFTLVLSLNEVVKIFQEVCGMSSHTVLSYDTTFQLGDFYMSPLIFRCVLFDEEPCIPLSAIIHDHKNLKVHQSFFHTMKEMIPSFNMAEIIVVTDREYAIVKAIQSVVPEIKHVLCWNHILKDVEVWVTTHEGCASDRKVYVNHIHSLLDSHSEQEFHNSFESLKQKWSMPFLQYFESKLKSDILEKCGRWILSDLGIYKTGSGVTTNVSESMNAVLKRLTQWKEVNLEHMVLAFYFLQTFYLKEVLRGRCGTGNYHLKVEHGSMELDSSNVFFPTDYMSPNDIIPFLQHKIVKTNDTGTTEDHQKSMTMEALAEMTIKQNRVFLQPQSQEFIVKGLKDKDYVVSLFPNEKCSCNSSRTCYHIVAARMSIGKSVKPKKMVYSLKKLKVGSRKFKSGRKKTRQKIHLETLAAPDSLEMQNLTFRTLDLPSGKTSLTKGLIEPVISDEDIVKELQEIPFVESLKQSTPKLRKDLVAPWDNVKAYPELKSVRIQNVSITIPDMKSLLDTEWLTDAIIDGFLLTRTTLENLRLSDVQLCVFSTHLMKSLEHSEGTTDVFNFGDKNILEKDIWLVPTNVHGNHWILIVIFLKWKIILYLDATHGFSSPSVVSIQKFLNYFMTSLKSKIDWSEWTVHAPVDIPLQKDSWNCGVHVCLYAHILCSGSLVPFPDDMTFIRMWISSQLLSNSGVNEKAIFPINRPRRQKHGLKRDDITDCIHLKSPPRDKANTLAFLSTALSEYFMSSWSTCFAGEKCKHPEASHMILCEGKCQDWYHLECTEKRGIKTHKKYVCPKCHSEL